MAQLQVHLCKNEARATVRRWPGLLCSCCRGPRNRDFVINEEDLEFFRERAASSVTISPVVEEKVSRLPWKFYDPKGELWIRGDIAILITLAPFILYFCFFAWCVISSSSKW